MPVERKLFTIPQDPGRSRRFKNGGPTPGQAKSWARKRANQRRRRAERAQGEAALKSVPFGHYPAWFYECTRTW